MELLHHVGDRRGTSLVEVLVAMVVFLVGILSVIRMFPPGFLAVKHSENITLANRLAQSELERWKGGAANLPAGILCLYPDGTVGVGEDPENMYDPPHVPVSDPYYYSDVNKFRHICAEATTIPAPSPTSWDNGSIYILGFSPIAWYGQNPVVAYSGPMRRRGWATYGAWSDVPTPRSSYDYYINYEEAEIRLRPAPYPRQFVITYSYWGDPGGARPRLETRLIQPIDVPSGSEIVKIEVPSDFIRLDRGSDSLHRAFVRLDPDGNWSTDPYEFKVLDPGAGVVAFNPRGYGLEEYTARGKAPLTAYIDYDVLDWHIIREDRRVADQISGPTDPSLEVKLTLRFMKRRGETREFDGSTYMGLAPDPPYNLGYDVLAVDLETGTWYSEQHEEELSGEPAMQVNYKEGAIRFHPNLQGRTFRIYYRVEDDWAVQVFKAYSTYRRSYNLNLDHRQYYYNSGDGRLYFPRCYACSTVAVDYSYRVATPGGGYRDCTVEGDSFQISEATGLGDKCYVDLREKLVTLHDGATVEIIEMTKVQGVSTGARVIWREGGRGLRAGRWKKVDLQTYLTGAQV